MVLICYLDDAGTDEISKFVSLSGYLGTVDAWGAFENDATDVMATFGTSYIRGRDLWGTRGDFENWSMNKKIEFIEALNNVLVKRLGLGLSFATLKSKFDERSEGRPRIQSAFGFSFEMLFHALIKDESFAKIVREHGINLLFKIEEGNKNNEGILQRYERA
jgi:hypothetical protein